MANSSVTVSHRPSAGQPRIVVVDWLSDDADGSATKVINLSGRIWKFVTNPGSVAPSDNYDITLVDEDGLDIAEGLLANRDTANSEAVYPYKEVALTGAVPAALPVYHHGQVTFTLANAGNAKTGQLKIYMQ